MTACRKAKTSSQSTAKEANFSAAAILAQASLAFPGLLASAAGISAEAFDFPTFLTSEAHGDSTVTTVSLSLASSASLVWHCVRGPLHDQAGEDLQKFSCVRLAMENGDLHQERREENGVEGLPVLLLFQACKVAGGGAKKYLCDW